MENNTLRKFIAYAIASAFAFATITFASPASAVTTLDAAGQFIKFENVDEEDLNGDPGYEVLYSNVVEIDGTSVDARLTYLGLADDALSATTDGYDDDDPDSYGIDASMFVYAESWEPGADFTPADGFSGNISFRLEFLLGGTNEPVILQNVTFYIVDIDSYQYIEIDTPTQYVLDAETGLEVHYTSDNADIGEDKVRFEETQGVSTSSDDQKHWVSVLFDEISTIEYELGMFTPGGAGYTLRFEPIEFDNPVEEPGEEVTAVPMSISKKVFFDGDSAYLKPMWFKKLDQLIASVPTCATDVTAKIISGVKKAKSEIKGSDLANRRAAIVKKFLTKRGLNTAITLKPNGKGKKAKNNQRFAKIVISYNGAKCN